MKSNDKKDSSNTCPQNFIACLLHTRFALTRYIPPTSSLLVRLPTSSLALLVAVAHFLADIHAISAANLYNWSEYTINAGNHPFQMASRLALVDAEIMLCRVEMERLELGVGHERLLFQVEYKQPQDSSEFDALQTRLRTVKKESYISNIEVLFKICCDFFGCDSNDTSGNGIVSITGHGVGSRVVKIKASAYGIYSGYAECDIDPYFKDTVPEGSKEPPAVRDSALSFCMDRKWSNCFFVSSFDLVKLLCTHFLLDSADKVQLLSSLDILYEDHAATELVTQAAARKKAEEDLIRLEVSFKRNVTVLTEYQPFTLAVKKLIHTEEYKHMDRYTVLSLLNELLKSSIYY